MEPARKQRLSSQVAMSLCTYIVERRLEVGERLPGERELAQTYEVSRHVLREAIAQLQWLGIVDVSQGRGTIVSKRPTANEVGHLVSQLDGVASRSHTESLEARTVFEAGLAELICERATSDDLERLNSILDTMQTRLETGLPIGADDVAFHEALLRCTRNDLLISTGQRLVLGYLHSSITELDEPQLSDVDASDLPGHRSIVAAISDRDPARLRDILRRHRFSRAALATTKV
ncbi:MAG: FadR family transcriptional regulator [Thermomicrobiales bacterium]|jgi:DNA-binding FadR family transcriptional regulator|nr:FadR family transcriptional regulator [Thermomicrobiales bacterium]